MIEVRIRHAASAEAVHLCQWDARRLEDLRQILVQWSVVDLDDTDDIVGQFVVDPDAAYFELVVGTV